MDNYHLPYRYIDLMLDLGFKQVFGKAGGEHRLITLLGVLIPDKTIIDLEYLDSEARPFAVGGKRPVCDVRCRLDDGTQVIIEIQRARQDDFYQRALFETGRLKTSFSRPVLCYRNLLHPLYGG